MAVAADDPPPLVEEGEPLGRQRTQRRPLVDPTRSAGPLADAIGWN
jgi:hypothetical protein